jgi:succinoglycan biosynthesis protein ExoO
MTASATAAARPDVSVIVPAWKAAAFISAAIASALASRGITIEVVVVDDASPDETFNVLRDLARTDPRIIVDRLASNGGPSAARNRAIELATGRFVAVLDADDTIEPDRLARLVSVADDESVDIVVDNMLEVDESGTLLGQGRFLSTPAFGVQRDLTLLDWARNNRPMAEGVCLGYLKPLIRRETLDRLSIRYDPMLRNSEDYYLVAHLLARGARMTYVPEPGYRYRRSASSTSSRLYPGDAENWIDAERRFGAEYGARFSSEEALEFRNRAALLRDVHHWAKAYEAVKDRKFAALTRILASSPASSRFTLAWFARAGLGKLTRAARMGR